MKNESNLEPDYKEMYFKMVRASEAAIRALADAQRNCEEIYVEAGAEADSKLLIDTRDTL